MFVHLLINPSLKLVDYLHVQADKPCYNYYCPHELTVVVPLVLGVVVITDVFTSSISPCFINKKTLNLVPVNEYKPLKIGNKVQFQEDIEIMKAICSGKSNSVPFGKD